jgi:hypothetical protein
MAEFPSETAVVLHDAGAANQAIAWIDAGLIPGHRVVVEGPAERLWAMRPRPPRLSGLDAALDGAAMLVSGTGWQSDLEHVARVQARARGVPTLAVLDHWVNYPQRFVRDGVRVLPDGLVVADAEAETLARESFPGVAVTRLPGLYLDAEVAGVRAAQAKADRRPAGVLVVLEPARDDWGRGVDGIFQALDSLCEHWDRLGLPRGAGFRLRPHPSDPPGHYDRWCRAHAELGPEVGSGGSLAADIAAAAHVVGLSSYALVVALAAGRDVVSILPPWAPPCPLPHAGLRHLRDCMGACA